MPVVSARGRTRRGERAGLEPNHAERPDQSENCAGLKLPLPNHVTFLRKKCEHEQGGEDH